MNNTLDNILELANTNNFLTKEVSFLNNYVKIHVNDEEELFDVRNRLEPYFQLNATQNFRGNIYSIYDKSIFSALSKIFASINETIVGHKGNTPQQTRFYKYFKYEGFNLFKSTKNDTIIISDDKSSVYVISDNKKNISIEIRRIVKDNILSRWAEKEGSAILHCACASKNDNGIIIMGEKGSGKTTTLLKLLLQYDAQFVTSDRGYIRINNGKLQLNGWPEPLNIGFGTLSGFSLNTLESHKSVKKGNEKIILPYNNIPELLSPIIDTALVNMILFPSVNLNNKSTINQLSESQVKSRITSQCLSPIDDEHPHWLGYVEFDEQEYEVYKANLIKLMSENLVGYEIVLGNDMTQLNIDSLFAKLI